MLSQDSIDETKDRLLLVLRQIMDGAEPLVEANVLELDRLFARNITRRSVSAETRSTRASAASVFAAGMEIAFVATHLHPRGAGGARELDLRQPRSS